MAKPQPPHSDRAHKAITDFLVRLMFHHHAEYDELVCPLKEGALYR